MSKIKKFSTILFGVLVFIFSAVIFVGYKDNKNYEDLYVFAKNGGSVQVNDNANLIRFGDGGKKFEFEENSTIKLKAIPDIGYTFVKWEYSSGLGETFQSYATNIEITITITDDVVIQAVFRLSGEGTYSITAHSGTGYSVEAESGYSTTVVAGGTFKFKVNLSSAYSESDIVVKSNGLTLNADVYGVYTISNITENIAITVENVVKNYYVITMNVSEGYDYIVENDINKDHVEYGSDFSFIVQASAGYESVVVTCNGSVITASQGVYTIPNVSANHVINIAQEQSYTVSVASDQHFTIEPYIVPSLTVAKGQTCKFRINIESNYEIVGDLSIIANNGDFIVNKNTSDNYYYIENITENISLTASGIKEKVDYSVTIPTSEYFTITNDKDEPYIKNTVSCKAGTEFKFKVKTNADKFIVGVEGNTIEAENGVYSVLVNENKHISVEAYYLVTLPSADGYSIKNADGGNINASSHVECGSIFNFKVVPGENYEVEVAVGESKLTPTDNKYSFKVEANTEIVIDAKQIYVFELALKDVDLQTTLGTLIPAKIRFAVSTSKPSTLKASEFMVTTLTSSGVKVKDFAMDTFISNLNADFTDCLGGQAEIDGIYYGDSMLMKFEGNNVLCSWANLGNDVTGTLKISVKLPKTYTLNLEFQDSGIQDVCSEAISKQIAFTETSTTKASSFAIKYDEKDYSIYEFTASLLDTVNIGMGMDEGYTQLVYQNAGGETVINVDLNTDTLEVVWTKLNGLTTLYIVLS